MSASVAAAAAAALSNRRSSTTSAVNTTKNSYPSYNYRRSAPLVPRMGRYELQKHRDWDTFGQYLRNHHDPPVTIRRFRGSHVLEFLRYLDQFGETKVHNSICPYFGQAYSPVDCSCPVKQAWTSLNAVVCRLRDAFVERGGSQENNPFAAPAVWLYLREVKVSQQLARGIAS